MIIYDSSSSYDYYDSVMKSGVDRSIKYIRKTEIVKKNIKLRKLHEINRYSYNIKDCFIDLSNVFLISICGNYYNGLQFSNFWINSYDRYYFYDKESLIKLLENSKFSKSKIKDLEPNWYYKSKETKIFESGYSKELFDLHIEYKTPILANSNSDNTIGNFNQFNLIKDANLKQFEFQKILDPFTIFQMIQQFISGVLSNPEKEIWPINDIVKAESHGFDKWSFRKQKHQRKG